MAVDYKSKYIDLRSKFSKSCDRYYRLGYEEGMKEGQQQAQMEAMQQQMMMQQQAAAGGAVDPETGMPIEGGAGGGDSMGGMSQEEAMAAQGGMPMEEGMDGMEEGGSELDQHINELETLVQKGEKPKVTDLRKAIEALSTFRKNKNKLKDNHKQVVVSKQKDFVSGILKKWESEANEKSVVENLEEIIASEGIKIK